MFSDERRIVEGGSARFDHVADEECSGEKHTDSTCSEVGDSEERIPRAKPACLLENDELLSFEGCHRKV